MSSKSSVEQYRSKVTELISKADITTVSAKGIRKQIESLTGKTLEPVKRGFDELVMEIYQKITDDIEQSVLNGTPSNHNQGYRQDYYPHSHQTHPHNHDHNHAQPTYAPPQAAPPQAAPPQAVPPQSSFGFSLPPTSYVPPEPEPEPSEDDEGDSDASFSSVEDGRSNKKAKVSSSGASKKSSSSTKKSTSSSTKSKSKTSSSSSSKKNKEKEKEKSKTKRKQPVNEDGTPKVNNFTRPMVISDKLYDVIGQAGTVGVSGRVEMSRPEVVKQLWVYIKSNGLQDESDKRNIKCDSKLKALFGHDEVNCFSMNKYLSGHLSKAEELV
ncbi:hypothetical protein CPC16_005472 [Podila verticillata]|nr:hypothetical protein BGZ59_009189 [Podila verticillata]KAF9368342.1 hypothetical protein CPC16_005472 [Podila verticillata]KFH69269.1 hypothetical protein MVEG_04084 [Podila verticillata NRRL 6337]